MKKKLALIIVSTVLLSMSFSIFADTVPDYSINYTYSGTIPNIDSNSSPISYQFRITALNPYYDSISYSNILVSESGNYSGSISVTSPDALWRESGSTSQVYTSQNEMRVTIKQNYIVQFNMQASTQQLEFLRTSLVAYLYTNARSSPTNGFEYISSGWDISEIVGDISSVNAFDGTDNQQVRLMIFPDSTLLNNGFVVLPAYSTIMGSFVITRTDLYKFTTTSSVFPNQVLPYSSFDIPVNNFTLSLPSSCQNSSRVSYYVPSNIKYINDNLINIINTQNTIISNQNLAYAQRNTTNDYLSNVNNNLQNIINSWNSNSSNANSLTNESQSLQNTTSNVHSAESNYYAQNETALNEVGISNFEFSSSQLDGNTKVLNLFSRLWTSLGDWNFVYTYALMISLVMFILRHFPHMKKKRE